LIDLNVPEKKAKEWLVSKIDDFISQKITKAKGYIIDFVKNPD